MESVMTSEQPRCKRCSSTLVYIRFRNSELVCRHCGHVEDLGVKEDG